MNAKPTTIELNGKRYDARTGKVLSKYENSASSHESHAKPAAKLSGTSIDGLSTRQSHAHRAKTTAHSVHSKTEKSKTLMRVAVKKPGITRVKSSTSHNFVQRRQAAQPDINPIRASRANSVKKSVLVSRFGTPKRSVAAITSVLPVRPEPSAPPAPLFSEHHKISIIGSTMHAGQNRSFQRAIDNSVSHHQPKARKTTRRQHLSRKMKVSARTVNLATASLAVLLLGGFIAYQNAPNLNMKVAAARAGVNGSLPGYQPSGFGLAGPISYKLGQITISYKSHSDGRNFQVKQQSSQWNSETLLDNYVAVNNKPYQTFQDGGKTIYIYDDNNATWVDGGVWYQIEGNSALNNDQLLRMAASM